MTLALAAAALVVYRNSLCPALFYWAFYRRTPARARALKNVPDVLSRAQLAFEFKMTALHALCDVAALAALWTVSRSGLSRLYYDISERGWLYSAASFAVLFALHDFYFYFNHRFMHWHGPLRAAHGLHHRSRNANPWTSWSVHPLETLIELSFFPAVAMVVPLHPWVLFAYVAISSTLIIHGHLGYELNPTVYGGHPAIASWIGTTTAHNMHHQSPKHHFGLYFRVWDRIFGTEHPRYEAVLREISERSAKGRSLRVQSASSRLD